MNPTISKVDNKSLNNGKGAVAHNGKSATPKAANLKGPHLRSDANIMLYGNDLPQLVVPLFKLVFPPSRAV